LQCLEAVDPRLHNPSNLARRAGAFLKDTADLDFCKGIPSASSRPASKGGLVESKGSARRLEGRRKETRRTTAGGFSQLDQTADAVNTNFRNYRRSRTRSELWLIAFKKA
jgi:hypothetical protein